MISRGSCVGEIGVGGGSGVFDGSEPARSVARGSAKLALHL